MEKLSVIVPCFNEEASLPFFWEAIIKTADSMKQVEFEILLINDGSKDKTLEILRKFSNEDKRFKYISFSRNFGKEAALYAGLEHAAGDYVAIIDADLQDPPELLPEMYRYIKEDGYDRVGTKRKDRKGESRFISFCSDMFYKIINMISQTEMENGARDYCLMTRPVVDAMLSMKEYNRYTKGIFAWIGFDTKWIEFENHERIAGKTTFGGFWKRVVYAIEAIVAFSTAPLVASTVVGILFCFLAFVGIILIIIRTLVFGDPTSGWPSMICILLLISGVQLFTAGIIGQYLAKAYLETKNRPVYIIKETEKSQERRIHK